MQSGAFMSEALPQYMTAREAAKYLRVSVNWLYLRSAEGKIPSVHFGRSLRFRKADLDRWAQTTLTGPKEVRVPRLFGEDG